MITFVIQKILFLVSRYPKYSYVFVEKVKKLSTYCSFNQLEMRSAL